MSPLINALTNATVASVIATVEDDTEVPVPRRTTRSHPARLVDMHPIYVFSLIIDCNKN